MSSLNRVKKLLSDSIDNARNGNGIREPDSINEDGIAIWKAITPGEPIWSLVVATPEGKIKFGMYDPETKKMLLPKEGDAAFSYSSEEVLDLIPALQSAVEYAKKL